MKAIRGQEERVHYAAELSALLLREQSPYLRSQSLQNRGEGCIFGFSLCLKSLVQFVLPCSRIARKRIMRVPIEHGSVLFGGNAGNSGNSRIC